MASYLNVVQIVDFQHQAGEVAAPVAVRLVELDDAERLNPFRVLITDANTIDLQGSGLQLGVEVAEGTDVLFKGAVAQALVGLFDVTVDKDVSRVRCAGQVSRFFSCSISHSCASSMIRKVSSKVIPLMVSRSWISMIRFSHR